MQPKSQAVIDRRNDAIVAAQNEWELRDEELERLDGHRQAMCWGPHGKCGGICDVQW